MSSQFALDSTKIPSPISLWRCAKPPINAVLHGNAYNPAKQVTAAFETNSDALVARIADQGTRLRPRRPP